MQRWQACCRIAERAVCEPGDATLRSVFEVHRVSPRFAELFADERLVAWLADRARRVRG